MHALARHWQQLACPPSLGVQQQPLLPVDKPKRTPWQASCHTTPLTRKGAAAAAALQPPAEDPGVAALLLLAGLQYNTPEAHQRDAMHHASKMMPAAASGPRGYGGPRFPHPPAGHQHCLDWEAGWQALTSQHSIAVVTAGGQLGPPAAQGTPSRCL